jgi:hypothetical protein
LCSWDGWRYLALGADIHIGQVGEIHFIKVQGNGLAFLRPLRRFVVCVVLFTAIFLRVRVYSED